MPYLEHNFELARRYVDCHMDSGQYECAYDVVLDDYEPEMKTTTVAALFDELKGELVPLIAEVTQQRRARSTTACCTATSRSPTSGGWSRETLSLMGFDPRRVADRRHRAPVRPEPGRRRRAHHHPLG